MAGSQAANEVANHWEDFWRTNYEFDLANFKMSINPMGPDVLDEFDRANQAKMESVEKSKNLPRKEDVGEDVWSEAEKMIKEIEDKYKMMIEFDKREYEREYYESEMSEMM